MKSVTVEFDKNMWMNIIQKIRSKSKEKSQKHKRITERISLRPAALELLKPVTVSANPSRSGDPEVGFFSALYPGAPVSKVHFKKIELPFFECSLVSENL